MNGSRLTHLFNLAEEAGGIDRAGARHAVELLLLLPVEGVEEGPVLQRELPELRRQRVLQHAAGVHAGNRHREVHLNPNRAPALLNETAAEAVGSCVSRPSRTLLPHLNPRRAVRIHLSVDYTTWRR